MKPYRYIPIAICITLTVVSAIGCSKRERAEVKKAIAAASSAEAIGDRAGMRNALQSIPSDVLTQDEANKLAQLRAVESLKDEIISAKAKGERAALKRAVETIKRQKLPVSSDEDSDYAAAVAGLSLEPELELARQKSDVDGLFLALTKLERSSFISPEEKDSLSKCRAALQELQAMRSHQAKHDHESVVQSADRILAVFPENVEARKAFNESGLIFTYLEAATQAVTGSTGAAKASAIGDAIKAEKDLAGTVAKLAEANKYLGEALKLDPQYAHSLAVQEAVEATQNVLAGLLAENTVKTAVVVMDESETMAVKVFNDVNAATKLSLELASRYSPARGYWEIYTDRYGEKMPEIAKVGQEALGSQSDKVALLKALRNRENGDLIDQAVRVLENADVVIKGFLMPSGTWSEYSNTIAKSQALMKDITDKFLNAHKGYEPVASRGLKTMATIVTIHYFRDEEHTKPILKKRQELLITHI